MAATMVKLLDRDPELGEDLSGARMEQAAEQVLAQTVVVDEGEWRQPSWPAGVRSGPGLLVIDGILMRRVGVEDRFGAELLGAGDLLRPWQREDAVTSVPRRLGWRVLRKCEIALLDIDFARRIAAFPEIHGRLVARALRRARALAVNVAILHQPTVLRRLHMLLWHFADRWGTVRSDGVVVPLQLTHAMLAELLAARRPTVSAAFGELERSGALARVQEGWLLRGAPPGELEAVLASAPRPAAR